jgi:hypothetical protein
VQQQLRELGAPDEIVTQCDEDEDAEVSEVGVMRCNWETVDVYLSVQPEIAVGMGGAAPIGIAAREVHAALLIRSVPRKLWRRVSDGVRIMFDEARASA